jgi:hypothetical protein
MDKSKLIKICLIITIGIQVFSYLLGIWLNNFGHDFGLFYRDVNGFWYGTGTYNFGFFYLNYFYYLCIWMLIPSYISLIIHVALTNIMFYLILKILDNDFENFWMYANLPLVLYYSIAFNTDVWVVFSLIFYQKYREKWWSPFFLLLGFFKITPIIVFGALFLINLIFEKKIRWNQVPALAIVFGITAISFLTSEGLMESAANFRNYIITDTGIDLIIQFSHLVWISYPIAVLWEYLELEEKKLRIFWIGFAIFSLIYTFITLYFVVSSGALERAFNKYK